MRRGRGRARPRPRRRWRRWPPSTSAAGCWCSPSTRPAGWPTRSASTGIGNEERRVGPRGVRRRRAEAPRRAVGGDARHQGVVGRPRPAPRPRRPHPRRHPRQPALRQHHGPLRPEPRLHRHGAAARAALVGSVRPDRRRHATHPQRPRLPRRPRPHGGVLRRSAAALAHGTDAQPRRRRGVAALPHRGRPGARRPLPAGHRRVLHPAAVDGEGLRRPRPRRQPR